MSEDDANEGHGAGECREHLWVMRHIALGFGGSSTIEYECACCGGLMVETPYDRIGHDPGM